MIDEKSNNTSKKSLKKRFLLVIGIIFFLIYLAFGLAVIFWSGLNLNMDNNLRYAFGGLIIVYAFFRFIRFFQNNNAI
jgi:cytochrome c biogenesis protein CcdA